MQTDSDANKISVYKELINGIPKEYLKFFPSKRELCEALGVAINEWNKH